MTFFKKLVTILCDNTGHKDTEDGQLVRVTGSTQARWACIDLVRNSEGTKERFQIKRIDIWYRGHQKNGSEREDKTIT